MNYFRLRNTGQVVSEAEYRGMYDKVFPIPLVPEDADAILETPAPITTEYQRTFKNGVKQDSKLNWVWDWDLVNMTSEEIAAYDAAKAASNAKAIAAKVETLWQAADSYVANYISGVAIGILTIGVLQGKPKAQAVNQWSEAIWSEYYIRKASITPTSEVNTSFTSFGQMPYTVPQLQAEIGL